MAGSQVVQNVLLPEAGGSSAFKIERARQILLEAPDTADLMITGNILEMLFYLFVIIFI